MSKKNLILLASAFSYRFPAFEAAAQKLGIPIVRGEDVPPPMVGKATVRLALDYRDVPRSAGLIERFAETEPVGAVIGLDDSGTRIAAEAARRLGLPHNSPEAARAAGDKAVMRTLFAAAGVPSPRFRRFPIDFDPREVAATIDYPCVLKPTTMAGSRGVMRADDPDEFVRRHARLVRILAAHRCEEFLVEDFIPGPEFALEGLLDGGRLHVLALFDKPDPLDGPFFEETIYVTPSRLPEAMQAQVAETAALAAASLGLRTGPVHAELRIPPGGAPVMVELAARSIGGSCAKTLRFSGEAGLEELILRQAFGLPFEPLRERRAGGVMMIPIPEAGILAGVRGLEAAEAVSGIEEIEISAPLNQPVVPLPEGDSYLGFIFARGATPAEVEAALREAHGRLEFEIAQELRVLMEH
ncbi:MAG TPA: ATP-grasp domain-containing protein [Anaerolineales bacterium]|nr:ATP-grasp domain-containing protein [Anaerolineales bacterium]